MLTFYRTADCPKCGHIQDILEDLQIVHKVVLVVDDNRQAAGLPEGARLPVLVDEGDVFEGSKAIIERLEYLERFKELWYKFQSDACYCDEDDEFELE